jgi:hypothetical protein
MRAVKLVDVVRLFGRRGVELSADAAANVLHKPFTCTISTPLT